MAHIEVWYRWRYFCEIRKKHFVTSYHCRESQIKKEHPDALPVESSRREQIVYDSQDEALKATCTACFAKPSGEQL